MIPHRPRHVLVTAADAAHELPLLRRHAQQQALVDANRVHIAQQVVDEVVPQQYVLMAVDYHPHPLLIHCLSARDGLGRHMMSLTQALLVASRRVVSPPLAGMV